MGITQQIGASSLIKPGVIDNTAARPASPYEGQVIFQKDTDAVLVWNGTAWYPNWNQAWGQVGYSSSTTAVTGITTITTTFTLSSITFVASRNYKITYFEPVVYCTSGSGEATLTIKNTTAATTIATSIATVNVNNSTTGILQFVTTFSAGAAVLTASVTYTTGSGSVVVSRSATRTAFLLVEDIGPA